MPQTDLFLIFVRRFNQAGFRYIIGGSVAAIFYGEPRMTNDVDLIVFLNEADLRRLTEVFPRAEFYVPPIESMVIEVARQQRGHFNIIDTQSSFKADIYPTGRDELNAWGFRNKRSVEYEGETLVLAPPEYIIVRKLEYYREGGSEKHVRDIRSMLRISGEQIDQAALQDWISRRGLQPQWQQVSS